MRRKNLLIILGVILLVVIIGSMLVYNQITKLAGYVDELPQGQNAVNIMSETEKSFLNNKLQKIETDMLESDLINILGPPFQYGTQVGNKKINQWYCPQTDKECLIRIKIQDGKVYAIEWLKMNSFFWEKTFAE